MTPFKRAENDKPQEKRGKVFVKIVLQKEGGPPGFPVPGSRKEQIVLEDATVGEVYDAINKALFG